MSLDLCALLWIEEALELSLLLICDDDENALLCLEGATYSILLNSKPFLLIIIVKRQLHSFLFGQKHFF